MRGRVLGLPLARSGAHVALGTLLAAVAAAAGAAVVSVPGLAFAVVAVAGGVLFTSAPTSAWVGAAFAASILLPGAANLGILPPLAGFLDMPLAWGALAIAGLKRSVRHGPGPAPLAQTVVRGLVGLGAGIVASFLLNPGLELLRAVVYLALLGSPLALLGALLLDPPSPRVRRRLALLVAGAAAAQLPLVAWQAATLGLSDPVQGTLYGKGAGAHLVGAFALVVALWLAAGPLELPRAFRYLAIPLVVVPFLADAKQVLFAGVLVLLVGGGRSIARVAGPRILVAGALVAMFLAYPATRVAVGFVDRALQGRWGKLEAARIVWGAVTEHPAAFLFGAGPATTVSRASFMTTDLLLKPNSPVRLLGLRPSAVAVEADLKARASAQETSFSSGQSSALGLLGDAGAVSFTIYLLVVVAVARGLIRVRTGVGRVMAGVWGMYLILGVVFDWWEEPPFGFTVALLTGLALTGVDALVRGRDERRRSTQALEVSV